MNSFAYVLFKFCDIVLNGVMLLMLVRAVISWFPGLGAGSRVMSFIHMVTEMVISPVRAVMSRFNIARGLPIDLSFFITYILLSMLRVLIASLYIRIL